MKYGARHLKRAIERHLVYPLASLLATEQVCLGDVISIDYSAFENALTFEKEAEGALLPAGEAELQRGVGASTGDGRAIPLVRTFAAAERLPPGNVCGESESGQSAMPVGSSVAKEAELREGDGERRDESVSRQ
jgi:hypothetical protein